MAPRAGLILCLGRECVSTCTLRDHVPCSLPTHALVVLAYHAAVVVHAVDVLSSINRSCITKLVTAANPARP